MNRSSERSSPPAPTQWDTGSILPDNTSEPLVKDISWQMGTGSNEKLSGEQLDWLLKRLSTDDQKELGTMLRNCTFEMTTTRGLPFAALVTGSMYFARSRLPANLQFGPKRWPFYAMIAVGSMTAANILSMNNCGERVKPKMFQLYQKYSANQPNQTTTYESLRAANRQHTAPPQYGQPPSGQQQQPPVIGDPRSIDPHPPAPKGYLYEEAPTMSGTPFTALPPTEPRERPPRERGGGGNSYGDKGFS